MFDKPTYLVDSDTFPESSVSVSWLGPSNDPGSLEASVSLSRLGCRRVDDVSLAVDFERSIVVDDTSWKESCSDGVLILWENHADKAISREIRCLK